MRDRYKVALYSFNAFLVALLAMASTAPRAEDAADANYSRSLHHYSLPNVNVVVHDGRKSTLSDVLDHGGPVIMNFIFTSCNAICPIMTAILSKVNAVMGPSTPELRFVSVSLDPEHDTPANLSEYAKKFKAGPNWQLLTGTVAELELVQRAFDAYRGDKMNHASLTFMRASKTSSWLRIDGLASAQDLIREYRLLTSPPSSSNSQVEDK